MTACPALLTPKIVKLFNVSRDQRERIEANRAIARIGWRPCRLVPLPEMISATMIGEKKQKKCCFRPPGSIWSGHNGRADRIESTRMEESAQTAKFADDHLLCSRTEEEGIRGVSI